MEMKNPVSLRHGRLVSALVMAVALVGCEGDGASTASNSASTPVVASAANGSPARLTTTGTGIAGTIQPRVEVVTPVGTIKPPPAAAAAGNATPLISGVAATSAKVGQAYSFQPRAIGMGDATLSFTISGAPKWTAFSSTTGRLSGTPTSADVGMTQNIVVQVNDGKSTAVLAAFAITVAAAGSSSGSATLSWQAPTENTDGSALANLGGYVIHYGTASKDYTTSVTVANPGLTRYVVEDLPAGTYYFSMTATTTSGVQSAASAEASMTIT
jgi:Putative Ig domain